MTLITVDVTLPLGTFVLDVQFSSDCRSIALFGPSGSGKTSLANVMAGLLTPQTGHIGINGTTLFDSAAGINLTPQQRGIGYVFQDNRLFPHMTIKDNLVYGKKWAPPNQNGPSFDDIVDLLDIGHLLNRTPAKLSGGESQRVAIGRALLMRPRIVLLDEPLASLDQERKAEIIHYLLKIRQASLAASLAPMITISHAPEEVNRLADEVVMMAEGSVKSVIRTPVQAVSKCQQGTDTVFDGIIGRCESCALQADRGHFDHRIGDRPQSGVGMTRPQRNRLPVRAVAKGEDHIDLDGITSIENIDVFRGKTVNRIAVIAKGCQRQRIDHTGRIGPRGIGFE